MGKMNDRRRKARKAKKKITKQLKSLGKTPFRVPTALASFSFKSKLNYNRKHDKAAIEKGLKDVV